MYYWNILKMNWVQQIRLDVWINHRTCIIWVDPDRYFKVRYMNVSTFELAEYLMKNYGDQGKFFIWYKSRMCGSKSYPPPPPPSPPPPPLWKFQSSFMQLLKFLGVWEPPPPRNFQSLLWRKYGYFLELHNSIIVLLFIQSNSQFKSIAKTCLPPSMLSSSSIDS